MEHTELYTQKLTKGKRTYFFDIKQTEEKKFYIKITESKPSNNGFEHHRVMVFEEDIEDFMVSFTQCIANYHKLKETKQITPQLNMFAEIREKHPNAYTPWTPEDDDKLEYFYCENKTIKELALIFKRKEGAIKSRIEKLALKEKYQ